MCCGNDKPERLSSIQECPMCHKSVIWPRWIQTEMGYLHAQCYKKYVAMQKTMKLAEQEDWDQVFAIDQ